MMSENVHAKLNDEQFLSSDAALAFRDGDFSAAASGFSVLSHEHPDDAKVLRYLGLSLDRLGEHVYAINAYKQALEVEPGSVATLFFLAVSQYKLGKNDEAGKNFMHVQSLAPESNYASSAGEFLLAMGVNPAPEPSRFSGFVQLGWQQDGNVSAAPEGVETKTDTSSEYLTIGYALVKTDALNISLNGGGYFSQQQNKDATGYNMNQGQASLGLNYVTALGGFPLMPSLSYSYQATRLDGEDYGNNRSLSTSLGAGLSDSIMITASYSASKQAVDDRGEHPEQTSRDSTAYSTGVSGRYFFPGKKAAITLAYNYGWSESDGSNAEYCSDTGSAGLWMRMPWQVDAQLSYTMGKTDYPRFVGDLPRDATSKTFNISFSKSLSKQVSLNLSGSGITEESENYEALSYRRNIVALSLGYQFWSGE